MKTLFYAVLTTAIGCASAHAQQVEVADSKVAGQPMADGSSLFYGTPYAAAPTGELRWKPPAPRAAWSGVLRRAARCTAMMPCWAACRRN